jgi:hypothetical protein
MTLIGFDLGAVIEPIESHESALDPNNCIHRIAAIEAIKRSGALFILVLIPYHRRHHRQLILIIMTSAFNYQPNLLAPYLALPQGNSIQAECVYCSLFSFLPLKSPCRRLD